MATNSTLAEQLLRQAVRKNVSEKLGSLSRDLGDFTEGMSDEEKKTAKLMILRMVSEACADFCAKMQQRLTSGK